MDKIDSIKDWRLVSFVSIFGGDYNKGLPLFTINCRMTEYRYSRLKCLNTVRKDDHSTNVFSLVSLNDLPAWAVYSLRVFKPHVDTS